MGTSVPLRAGRLLTALMAVWCLGCSAFDPLLAALAEESAPSAACTDSAAGDGGLPGPRSDSGPAIDEPSGDDSTGPGCACAQFCGAVSPTTAAVAGTPGASFRAASLEVSEPPSAERRPLIPPPERVTA